MEIDDLIGFYKSAYVKIVFLRFKTRKSWKLRIRSKQASFLGCCFNAKILILLLGALVVISYKYLEEATCVSFVNYKRNSFCSDQIGESEDRSFSKMNLLEVAKVEAQTERGHKLKLNCNNNNQKSHHRASKNWRPKLVPDLIKKLTITRQFISKRVIVSTN